MLIIDLFVPLRQYRINLLKIEMTAESKNATNHIQFINKPPELLKINSQLIPVYCATF